MRNVLQNMHCRRQEHLHRKNSRTVNIDASYVILIPKAWPGCMGSVNEAKSPGPYYVHKEISSYFLSYSQTSTL